MTDAFGAVYLPAVRADAELTYMLTRCDILPYDEIGYRLVEIGVYSNAAVVRLGIGYIHIRHPEGLFQQRAELPQLFLILKIAFRRDTHAEEHIGVPADGADIAVEQIFRGIAFVLFPFRPSPAAAEGGMIAVRHIGLCRPVIYAVRIADSGLFVGGAAVVSRVAGVRRRPAVFGSESVLVADPSRDVRP